jgi:hypothetical protein
MHSKPAVLLIGAITAAATAGPVITSSAGGYGRGIARYVAGSVIQDLEELSFNFPTTEIGYQRAELSSSTAPAFGFAGGAGFGLSKPLDGKLSFSTGTRVQTDNQQQFLGDADGSAFYNDTFDVRSDTLAIGTVIDIVLRYSANTLDSTNHTVDTPGGQGFNDASNFGSLFLRARSDAPTDNLHQHSATYSRNRAGEVAATGIFSQEFMSEDGDPNTHSGLQTYTLRAVVGSTITFEAMLVGETTSRAQFTQEGNTGFCATLLFGFDLEDAFLESRLVPGMDIPTGADVTRERAILETPPGPEFVVPAPGSLALLGAAGLLASRRRR